MCTSMRGCIHARPARPCNCDGLCEKHEGACPRLVQRLTFRVAYLPDLSDLSDWPFGIVESCRRCAVARLALVADVDQRRDDARRLIGELGGVRWDYDSKMVLPDGVTDFSLDDGAYYGRAYFRAQADWP